MNRFEFVGTIPKPKDKSNMISATKSGKKYLKLLIRQNENNSAYVQLYGDTLYNGAIPVHVKNSSKRFTINFDNRFDENILSKVSYYDKYTIKHDNVAHEFIWKDDFMDYAYELITNMPNNTIYKVTGEFFISQVNSKTYNNFSIRKIEITNSLEPKLTLSFDLFYNHKSLDESDKRNKFIINGYLEQYNYSSKQKEYYPFQTQFVTNRFDFKNPTDVEQIIHRKANLSPSKEEGYVKATWEAQYVRGAQLIMPPLETLPKDIQFEIKNAGREIKEYMSNVVGETSEFICLTRPDNTATKDGKVYMSLKCTDNEFENKINSQFKVNENTIDNLAEKDAKENPFN